MKKILLLFSETSIHKSHNPEELARQLTDSANSRDHEARFDVAMYEDLMYVIQPEGGKIVHSVTGEDIASYNLVYQRRWEDKQDQSLACAIYLKHKGVPFVDSESYNNSSKNKLTQAWRFWEAGLPHPKTVCFGSTQAQQRLLDNLESLPLDFPLIAKELNGFGGNNNYLVHTVEELSAVFLKNPDMRFILQEYIPNKGDYRVIVYGDRVGLAIKRVAAEGMHTNNSSQGGRGELVAVDDVPANILDDSVKAATLLGREVAGVDVVVHEKTGKHYFFEVNRCPQIETGLFVKEKADTLADYLYSEAQ